MFSLFFGKYKVLLLQSQAFEREGLRHECFRGGVLVLGGFADGAHCLNENVPLFSLDYL